MDKTAALHYSDKYYFYIETLYFSTGRKQQL